MAFSDFPMPADYPAYARHDQVAAYFDAYVDHFGFRDRITFDTTVDRRLPRGRRHAGRCATTGPDGDQIRDYDAVLVANGHHWDPRWPEPAYPGAFDGEQIHAHDYRSGDQLAGRDVVVVGAGNSAIDIAVEAGLGGAHGAPVARRGQWVLRKFALGKPSRPGRPAGVAAVVGHRRTAAHRGDVRRQHDEVRPAGADAQARPVPPGAVRRASASASTPVR